MAINPNEAREFEWDDVIENDGQEFRVLPEGDYPFTIVALEKARHTPQPGGKMPACNKAILTVRLEDQDGSTADNKYNLFLHSSQEWKLCEFFAGIGARKKGEPLKMNWAIVVGSTGICHVKVRSYASRNDPSQQLQSNDISKWYPKDTSPEFQEGQF